MESTHPNPRRTQPLTTQTTGVLLFFLSIVVRYILAWGHISCYAGYFCCVFFCEIFMRLSLFLSCVRWFANAASELLRLLLWCALGAGRDKGYAFCKV